MVYNVCQKVDKKDESKVLKAYYEFFTKMYGLVSVRFFGHPNFTTNVDNHDFWDRGDSNFQHALEVLNAPEGTYNFLMGYDDLSHENLELVSRFKVATDELIASEIVTIPQSKEEIKKLVIMGAGILEKIAQENNIPNVVIEASLRDLTTLNTLKNLGYLEDRANDEPFTQYATVLLSKNIPLLESSNSHGRYLSNK